MSEENKEADTATPAPTTPAPDTAAGKCIFLTILLTVMDV